MRKQYGQIAIITLFSLAVFVVIGGSIVTQIIFEQKKAVLEEKSRQAYYAAESGIEKALQELINTGKLEAAQISVGKADVSIEVNTSNGGHYFSVPVSLSSGESYFLNLQNYDSNRLRVCWDKSETGLIFSYFFRDGANVLHSESYAVNSQGSSNQYLANTPSSLRSSDGVCNLQGNVYYSDLNLPSGEPAYLLAWIIYQDGVQVAFEALDGADIIDQYTVITSTGKVAEGVGSNNDGNVIREVKYAISISGGNTFVYPPAWLTVPVYAEGGVTYRSN